MMKQVTCSVKVIKKPSSEPVLGTTVLNILIDNL